MNNEQIIVNAAVAAGLYTPEEAEKVLEEAGELPLHSLIGWKMRSPKGYEYRVKKGEHGLETRLWRKKKKKGQDQDADQDDQNGTVELMRDFYLTKTFLFSEKQVELVKMEVAANE